MKVTKWDIKNMFRVDIIEQDVDHHHYPYHHPHPHIKITITMFFKKDLTAMYVHC